MGLVFLAAALSAPVMAPYTRDHRRSHGGECSAPSQAVLGAQGQPTALPVSIPHPREGADAGPCPAQGYKTCKQQPIHRRIRRR